MKDKSKLRTKKPSPINYEMRSQEGNVAVHSFLTKMHKTFWDELSKLKKKFPESDDTEVTEKIHSIISRLYWWDPADGSHLPVKKK